ncbi:MAG: Ig-like domain-containing protein [Gemmatimonadaceae bacterium]
MTLPLPPVRTRLGYLLTPLLCLTLAPGCGGAEKAAAPPIVPPPVVVPVVTTVTVSPGTSALTVGGNATLTATVTDQLGATMTSKTVSWSSSAGAIASVAASGVVTALSPGSATITATVDGKSGAAAITVSVATTPSEFQTVVPTIALNAVLARPTTTSVTVSAFATTDRDVTLTWTPNGGSLTRRLTGGMVSALEITGLTADRAYRFTLESPGATTVQGQFRTARATGSTYRFVMQADSHLDANSDTKIYVNTLANMLADSADFLVDLGDTFMTDKYAAYADAAPHYYAQRYYFGLVGHALPTYLVEGNHDGETGWLPAMALWSAGMRTRYFTPVTANPFYSTALTPRNYYAWSWGNATHIVLDPYVATVSKPSTSGSNWGWTLGKEQYDWLVATLQRTTTPFTFVYLHNLVGGYTSEARGGSEASVWWEWGGANADGTAGFATQRPGWGKPIHDLLVQYKVSAVFHGHDHLYVQQSRDGMIYQEVPQPSFGRENQTSSAVPYGYLSGVLYASSGHVRVTVGPTKATVEYIRSRIGAGNGDVVHRYDIAPAVRP